MDIHQISHATMLAWARMKKAQAKTWGEWMTIGEGLIEGRRWAMQQAGADTPQGRGYITAFSEWLKRYKLDDMDASDRAKLLQIMEERAAVEEWRSTLTDHERRNLNNPVMVWRKWTAATKVKKKPKKGGPGARERAMIEEQQARIQELEEERLNPDDEPLAVVDRLLATYPPEVIEEIIRLLREGLRKAA